MSLVMGIRRAEAVAGLAAHRHGVGAVHGLPLPAGVLADGVRVEALMGVAKDVAARLKAAGLAELVPEVALFSVSPAVGMSEQEFADLLEIYNEN